jgi:hypothetical protein
MLFFFMLLLIIVNQMLLHCAFLIGEEEIEFGKLNWGIADNRISCQLPSIDQSPFIQKLSSFSDVTQFSASHILWLIFGIENLNR